MVGPPQGPLSVQKIGKSECKDICRVDAEIDG